jgi:hypothetical protein
VSYWDRVLNDPEQPQQQQPRPSPVPAGPQRAWWRPSERPQPEPVPQQVAYDDPSYYPNPHGYAVNPTNVGKDAQLIGRILEEGYIRKPPKWVQQQPTDRCPECDSPNYAQLSGYGKDGVYGGTIRTKNGPLIFMRCWNCGYSTTGARTEAIEGARSTGGGPVMGAARQTAQGGANIQNFGEITMTEWQTR